MKFKILFLIFTGLFCTKIQAQDPIFTQYFLVPETLNPGFTGFMETTYMGVIHREQWPDLNLKIATDYAFVNTYNDEMNSGFGLSVLNQRENLSNYVFTQVNLNYAYKVRLSHNWYFRPGLEVGYGYKSFGFENLLLQDQINIRSGTINSTSVDPSILNNKVHFLDVSAGMVFNKEDFWVGLSIKHLNRPNISFSEGENLPLEAFFSLSTGYEFLIADYIDVLLFPYVTKLLITSNYMQQGRYNRLDIGASIMFEHMLFGFTTVTNPAKNGEYGNLVRSINVFTGLQIKNLRLGLSYDINTSNMGKTGGVYELTLTYQFNLNGRCFGCPCYTD